MSNKNLNQAEIQKTRDKCANTAVAICIASIVGIVFSPSILVTVAVTILGGGFGYFSLKKIEKLNESEKDPIG